MGSSGMGATPAPTYSPYTPDPPVYSPSAVYSPTPGYSPSAGYSPTPSGPSYSPAPLYSPGNATPPVSRVRRCLATPPHTQAIVAPQVAPLVLATPGQGESRGQLATRPIIQVVVRHTLWQGRGAVLH